MRIRGPISRPASTLADSRRATLPLVVVLVGGMALLQWAVRERPGPAPKPCGPEGAAVVMLSTSWCGYCRAARRHLTARAVDWCELDVEATDAGAARYQAVGGRGVPVFVDGDRVLQGFSERMFDDWYPQKVAPNAGGS